MSIDERIKLVREAIGKIESARKNHNPELDDDKIAHMEALMMLANVGFLWRHVKAILDDYERLRAEEIDNAKQERST